MVVILGPTASGKTSLAVKLAYDFNGEIISADSRQVYKGMDIGTGKDLKDYEYKDKVIQYHLIDIINPDTDYSVYKFKLDYKKALENIIRKDKQPFLCGGTGLYIESILLNYHIADVPPDLSLRNKLESYNLSELITLLKSKFNNQFNPDYHNSKRRVIRSLEILFNNNSDILKMNINNNSSKDILVIGIKIDRYENLKLIKNRLLSRLNDGMVEEVENLINNGLSINRLNYFGLEYKFIGKYLNNELSYEDMVEKLNIAINQFSKRQMTFFRRMEKRGIDIKWIEINNYNQAYSLTNLHF